MGVVMYDACNLLPEGSILYVSCGVIVFALPDVGWFIVHLTRPETSRHPIGDIASFLARKDAQTISGE